MKNKIDPRTTILTIVIISTLSVLAINVYYLFAIFLIALLVNLIFGLNPFLAIYRMRRLLSLIVFIALFQSLTTSKGVSLIEVFGVKLVTSEGAISSLSFVLRMGILMLAVLLGSNHDSREMIDGLVKLRVPYELAFMTGIALKFIPLFRQEFADRINAVSLRGINIKKLRISKKAKLYSYILVPAISGSIIKSRDIASSMETRGFRAYPTRTSLRELKMTIIDYTLMGLVVLIFAFIIYLMFIRR